MDGNWLVFSNNKLSILPVEKENMILKCAKALRKKIEKQFKSSKTLGLAVAMVRSRQ